MSEHTHDYLETFVRIGCTDKRGNAWHWRKGDTNHFPGFIPPAVVLELLQQAFAIEKPVYTLDADGTVFEIPERKAIVIPGMGNHVAGVHGEGFAVHQYVETLYRLTLGLVNGETGYASAGIIKHGNQAWVQIEAPENSEAAGMQFRAGLLAATSLDGSLATTFKPTGTFVVCDNTFSWAINSGAGEREAVKVKHTRFSLAKLAEQGEAIEALNALAADMGYAIEKASDTKVTDAQFAAFLDALVPMPKPEDDKTGRARTLASQKRDAIGSLYREDERAAPWSGTALGVMQAVNTYTNHEAPVRGAERAERVADQTISGRLNVLDKLAWETLNKVLVAA